MFPWVSCSPLPSRYHVVGRTARSANAILPLGPAAAAGCDSPPNDAIAVSITATVAAERTRTPIRRGVQRARRF